MNALAAVLPWLAFGAPLAPLFAALALALRCVGLARRPPSDLLAADAEEAPSARLALAGALIALACLLAAGAGVLAAGPPGTLVAGRWFGPVTLALTPDAPGLAFAIVIAVVGAVTLRFSQRYLHREPGFHRFLLAMSLFLTGMLLIALAGNAVLAFVGWELAGVSSYLLIGYVHERPVATANAQFAFVTNRIGDAGFLAAIALAVLAIGDSGWDALAGDSIDALTARLIALGFVLAAIVKSAQLPFSPWIARALEGPTPSSAIFYGSLMVHAGVFLLIRCQPLLVQVPDVLALIGLVGVATTLYGALAAPVQTDAKSSLMFSTLANVGLMFVAIGLGWFTLAAAHLVLHAAWRAAQFLLAPSLLELANPRPAPPWPPWLHALALRRLWLEEIAQTVVVRPLVAMADDAREFDERLLAPLAGAPDALPAAPAADGDRQLIDSPGVVGHALFLLAGQLQRFEARLLLQQGDSNFTRGLHRAGGYLTAIERLLEQPRYLLVLVAITFVVIL